MISQHNLTLIFIQRFLSQDTYMNSMDFGSSPCKRNVFQYMQKVNRLCSGPFFFIFHGNTWATKPGKTHIGPERDPQGAS